MSSAAPWRPAELSRALRDLAAAATQAGAGTADTPRLQEALARVSGELAVVAAAGGDSPAALASQLPDVQPGVGATLTQVASAVLRLEAVSGPLKALLLGPLLSAAKCLAPSDTSLELLQAVRAAADLVASGPAESLDTKFLASAWEGIVACVLSPSSGSADTLPPAFAAYGTQLAHALAAHVSAHATQAACAGSGSPAARSKLAAFFAGHLLKLVAKQPRIGASAWSSLVKAASDVRLAVWSASDAAVLDAACLVRADACLYRTLESTMATTDGTQCDALLTALCDTTAAASSHQYASCARVATFCDAVLARLSQHRSPALAGLALRHMDWALGVGTAQGMPLLLRLPPPAAGFRATLRHGLGHALAVAAGHGSTHWNTAEQFLASSCVASHPLARSLCLDVWSDLVASAPPELGDQHLRLVLTLAHATGEAAQKGDAYAAAVLPQLCHAAVRILGACPDGGQLLEDTYARLFMAPQLCTSALVMLHAGPFPLRRLRGAATASHAAHTLLSALAPYASTSPEHAAKAALAVMRAVTPAPPPASLAAWCDPCLAVLSQCGQTSPRQHAACDACCALLVRLCGRVESSRATQFAEAVMRHAEAGCIGARNALPFLLSATTQEVPGRGVPEALTQRVFDAAFALQAWPHTLATCEEFVARCRVAPGGVKSLGQLIPPHAALGGLAGVKAVARRPLMTDFRQAAAACVEWGADAGEAHCLENDAAALNAAAAARV